MRAQARVGGELAVLGQPLREGTGTHAEAETGIYVKRDTQVSIAYSEELIFPISATLQNTDRHHGIVGQERCHFQLDS